MTGASYKATTITILLHDLEILLFALVSVYKYCKNEVLFEKISKIWWSILINSSPETKAIKSRNLNRTSTYSMKF